MFLLRLGRLFSMCQECLGVPSIKTATGLFSP